MSTLEHVNISHTLGPRTAARFAVIQALYQIETTDEVLLEPVLKGFLRHFNSVDLDGMELGEYDQQLFQAILEGISRVASDLDDMIYGSLSDKWSLARLDSVMRAILRAGTFELSERLDIPAKVTIDEYVTLANLFFSGKEPAMVNGTLVTIAETLRPEELNEN
ncbi:transcription antitermination factor NusB [Alphaproteobacteria bacterium]|jgi:N utilization substance protein B|nr:transcription antitermination factor NusB [Alphaproteobacteria bacterium]